MHVFRKIKSFLSSRHHKEPIQIPTGTEVVKKKVKIFWGFTSLATQGDHLSTKWRSYHLQKKKNEWLIAGGGSGKYRKLICSVKNDEPAVMLSIGKGREKSLFAFLSGRTDHTSEQRRRRFYRGGGVSPNNKKSVADTTWLSPSPEGRLFRPDAAGYAGLKFSGAGITGPNQRKQKKGD